MGAGSTLAGSTPAGLDDVDSSAVVVLPTLKAPLYDPAIRGFAVDEAGEYPIHVHPVIERAALLIGMRRGSSPSNRNTGLNTRRIYDADDDSVQNVAADEVRIALRPLLEAGDIRIVAVEVQRDLGGSRTAMVVTVANLREPGAPNVPIRRAY
jgi:hypothetical protein